MYHIVILEPNQELKKPYDLFEKEPHKYSVARCQKLPALRQYLKKNLPELICVSTSFSAEELLKILDDIKNCAKKTRQLPHLLFVVNWKNPLSQILGTHWDGHIGVIHTLTNAAEFRATLSRVLGR